MDVRRLDLLRELAERGSVTAVAKARHLTPSAVSQQLQRLEKEAGLPLTRRDGRGLAVTDHGRVLADAARRLAVAEEAVTSLWEDYTASAQGVVTLTLFASGGEMLLPGVLDRLAESPGPRLVADIAEPLEGFGALAADRDLVVADAPGIVADWRERGLETVELFREPLDVVLPDDHPLAARTSLSPEDVVDEPWIGVPEGFPYDRILTRVEEITGRDAERRQRIADNGVVEALVAAGHGIAILPRFTTRDRENGLVTRPLDGVRSERVIWAILRPENAVRPAVRHVLEALRAEGAVVAASHGVRPPRGVRAPRVVG